MDIITNPEEHESSRLRGFIAMVGELLKVALISLAIIIPVRYFLIQPFYVKGASMEPNFYDHEYLIIDELSYRLASPERGEIIVFRYPKDPNQYFIKRVIGLPGERVVVKDGGVYIAKQADQEPVRIDEGYLTPGVLTELAVRGYGDVTLGADEYFLLGDNRERSLDSRVFGPVNRSFIIGKTWLRGWPVNRMTVFGAPSYNL